jgi:hypothetical protein
MPSSIFLYILEEEKKSFNVFFVKFFFIIYGPSIQFLHLNYLVVE